MGRQLKRGAAGVLAAVAFLWSVPSAVAQEFSLNPDGLSFFEEPLALDLFGFTLSHNQLIDQPISYDFENEKKGYDTRIEFRTALERQLPNAWTVGAVYLGSYERERASEYEDSWAVYAGSVWGQVAAGDVTTTVRDATRRMRGAGNADLAFDDVIGSPAGDYSAAYNLRLGAFTLNALVDSEAQTDFGLTYDRPGEWVDYRFTARYARGWMPALDGSTTFDTHGGMLVGGLVYGSVVADLGIGYERLDSGLADGDRFFFSTGIYYKVRRISVSLAGHYGMIDGDIETSVAVGARYDIARGLSVNLGYNFANSDADISGVPVRNANVSEVKFSLRYEL